MNSAISQAQQIGHVKCTTDHLDPVGGQAREIKFAKVNAAKNGDVTLIAAVSGKKIRVLSGCLVGSAGDGSATFFTGTSATPLTGVIPIDIAGGADGQDRIDLSAANHPFGVFETVAGELLGVTLSANMDLDGWLVYIEV